MKEMKVGLTKKYQLENRSHCIVTAFVRLTTWRGGKKRQETTIVVFTAESAFRECYTYIHAQVSKYFINVNKYHSSLFTHA